MSVPSKWWLCLFVIWIGVVLLCSVTVGGTAIASKEGSQLTGITSVSANPFSIGKLYTTVTGIFNWDGDKMTFFTDGIGYYIRIFLLCLTAAIVIPFVFDVVRLLFFRG